MLSLLTSIALEKGFGSFLTSLKKEGHSKVFSPKPDDPIFIQSKASNVIYISWHVMLVLSSSQYLMM